MNGERFLEEIEKKIGPDENYADIVTMINILANERAKANNRDIKDEDYDYAAGIICIVFPMKPPKYKDDIEALRTPIPERFLQNAHFLRVWDGH
jgi:hypothetical protein